MDRTHSRISSTDIARLFIDITLHTIVLSQKKAWCFIFISEIWHYLLAIRKLDIASTAATGGWSVCSAATWWIMWHNVKGRNLQNGLQSYNMRRQRKVRWLPHIITLTEKYCLDWSGEMFMRSYETKLQPFSRRHFQMHFLQWKCMNFTSDFTEVCSQWSN